VSVGSHLRKAREHLGLTQAELAVLVGRTPTAISYWEGGQRSPGLDDLLDLAAALQVEPASLLPARPAKVLARAQAAELAVEDLAEAVDRVVDTFDAKTLPASPPQAPTTNPAEAAGFARRRAKQTTAPVDVRAVLAVCGCHYAEVSLPESLQGFVATTDGGPVVVVRDEDPPTRRRFTAAHELGHVLLRHHDTFHVDLHASEGSPPNFNWRHERAANDFAASLLMPEELVRERVENAVRSTTAGLAKAFGVSTQAMAIRLSALGMSIAP
jgi:transcriptional regulator with XRE-family HTH domain